MEEKNITAKQNPPPLLPAEKTENFIGAEKQKLFYWWQKYKEIFCHISRKKAIGAGAVLAITIAAVSWVYLDKAVYAADEKNPIINKEVATLILDDLATGRKTLDNVIALHQLGLIHWPLKQGKYDEAYLQGTPNCLEGLVLACRLTGLEKEVWQQYGKKGQPLEDIPDWGKPFVSYAQNQGMVTDKNMDWLAPLDTAQYLSFLSGALAVQQNQMPLTALQKYRNLTMQRGVLADISYHFLCLKEVQLNIKTGTVTSLCWGDRLIQREVITEKQAILADLPILQNDSYRYEKYFLEQLKEESGLFAFTPKNKEYMQKWMANQNSYWVFVDKTHLLPETFVPNLTDKQTLPATTQNGLLEPFVEAQMQKLFAGAKADGIGLFARSGYRSFQTQKILYGDGSNPYRAKPGSSEHQTGLAMDVVNKANRLDNSLAQSKEALWLRDHAHEYGFIIRYPADKEEVTGYPAEWWHLRYVGKQIAYTCYVNHWTYDEFFAACHQ